MNVTAITAQLPPAQWSVTVVVTHTEESEARRRFLWEFCLPSIFAAKPAEVILVRGPETAGAKRNAGAELASREYLLFWDDDCIMSAAYLPEMIAALQSSPDKVAFAYCDALEIVHPEAPRHPFSGVKVRLSKTWNPGSLRRGNYISNMSIMKRAAFRGCDETLKRLVDYDMWLSMVDAGYEGVHVPRVLYHAYYLDQGISAGTTSYDAALRAVRARHPR